jgi:ElaA protein
MPILAAARPRSPVAMRWQWGRLPALAAGELYATMAARQQVFAVEQNCAYLDADGLDVHAWHLLGWDPAGDTPALASYLRIVDPGRRFVEPSIGRVLTTAPYRGQGLGRVVMSEGLARAARAFPGQAVRIAAQQRLEAFYARLGFVTASAPFDEDGIPHVEMLRPGNAANAA